MELLPRALALTPSLALRMATACVLLTLLQLAISLPGPELPEGGARPLQEWAIRFDGGMSDAKALGRRLGLQLDRKIDGLDDVFIFKRNDRIRSKSPRRLRRSPSVLWMEQQMAHVRTKRSLTFNDLYFPRQWYLLAGSASGNDMNVREAWERGLTGRGVVISILDDGIERDHPELRKNYDPMASFDLNNRDEDPTPRLDLANSNAHGTRCACVAVAEANNSHCTVGVAHKASIGGVRMLDGDVTDAVEAAAIAFHQQHIDIYASAWGPDDNGKVVEGPGTLAQRALKTGVTSGRRGLGNIFMWASGNGGRSVDSCACDGYAGSIYTLSVSSVTEQNTKPWYLEECASTLASTYSSGSSNDRKVLTCSIRRKCTAAFTGTSASVSMAAGIVALTLEANANLTWRDVQYLTLMTANPEPLVDAQWITNAVGRKVSLRFGYGLMDAGRMTYLAPLWRRVPEHRTCESVTQYFSQDLMSVRKHKIPFTIDNCLNDSRTAITFVEHVQLYLRISLSRRGALRIKLRSPSGTFSTLLPPRPKDNSFHSAQFDRWPLTSVHYWGERPEGTWWVYIANVDGRPRMGRIVWARLVLHGVAAERPVRLMPPGPEPPAWFEQFRHLVTTEEDLEATGCHSECANATACSGPASSQCDACRSARVLGSGDCVATCPPGTFLNASSALCLPCHPSCERCVGSLEGNCTVCPFGAYLLAGRCRPDGCPEGMFAGASGRCRRCGPNCARCRAESRCLRCRAGKVLTPNGSCVQGCPPRHFVSSERRCNQCHLTCEACIAPSAAACLACPLGAMLLKANMSAASGACVPECPLDSFRREAICVKCHPSCGACSGPGDRACLACRQPLIENGARCVDPESLLCGPGTLMIRCLTNLVKNTMWKVHQLAKVVAKLTPP